MLDARGVSRITSFQQLGNYIDRSPAPNSLKTIPIHRLRNDRDMRPLHQSVLLRVGRAHLAYSARLGNHVQPKIVRAGLATAIAGQGVAPPASPSHSAQQPPPHFVASESDANHQQRNRQILRKAVAASAPRQDWSRDEISAIYHQPLMELAYQAVSLRFRVLTASAAPHMARVADPRTRRISTADSTTPLKSSSARS